MKKAIKINLGGLVFHIDEDAYEKLSVYLRSVESYFKQEEGGREVIDDIESRMAELFSARLGSGREVVVLADVEAVIETMGDPYEIGDDDQRQESFSRHKTKRQSGRRLYRDPDNAILGGICAGMAAYFGLENWVVRLIFFLLLIFGHAGTAFVYLVLWIVIPKAATISQKLEMRGESVTVSNIERSVREEISHVETNLKKMSRSETANQARSALNEMFHVLGRIVLFLVKFALVLLGIGFVLAGLSLLLVFMVLFFLKSSFFPFGFFSSELAFIPEMISFFVSSASVTVALIALFLFVVIPLVALIYAGLRMIFGFRSKVGSIAVAAVVLWVLSLGVLSTVAALEGTKFSSRTNRNVAKELMVSNDKTLVIKMESTFIPDPDRFVSLDFARYKVFYNQEDAKIYGIPKIHIRKTNRDYPEVEVMKKAFGHNNEVAAKNAMEIEYSWRQEDSVIYLSPYYSVAEGKKWNFPEVNVFIRIPEGYRFVLDENLDETLSSVPGFSRYRLWTLKGKTMEVGEETFSTLRD